MTIPARSQKAFDEYLKRLEVFGCTDLGDTWEGSRTRRKLRCPKGHVVEVLPTNIQKGNGPCRVCAGIDPGTTFREYLLLLPILGYVDLGEEWEGVDRPRKIKCPNGHISWARPNNIKQRGGSCSVCAGRDAGAALQNYRDNLRLIGCTDLGGTWEGTNKPRLLRCPSGHVSSPRPSSLSQGQGPCHFCAGKTWDIFYLVTHPDSGNVKFGITSGDPRQRLLSHRRLGYTRVHEILSDLPDSDARRLELTCMDRLKQAGIKPLSGREWFDSTALPVVRRVVAEYDPFAVS